LQNQASLQEKNSALTESVIHLKEELRNVDNRRLQVEADIRTVQAELAETQRKLNIADASLHVQSKASISVLAGKCLNFNKTRQISYNSEFCAV